MESLSSSLKWTGICIKCFACYAKYSLTVNELLTILLMLNMREQANLPALKVSFFILRQYYDKL